MPSRSKNEGTLFLLQQEMAPYPGRLAGSLRNILGVTIALVIAMTLRVPGISLALALLFLMQRERPGLTWRMGLQIFSGAVVACFGSFLWVQLTDGVDMARFVGVIFVVFISAFCTTSTAVPLFWTIFGFYGFLDMAAWDVHRSTDAIVTSSLYNIASLGLVVLSGGAVEYLFATRHPAEALDMEMKKRLTSLQRFFEALAETRSGKDREELDARHKDLIQQALAGNLYMNELYDRLRDASSDPSQIPLGLHYRIGLLTRVLDKSILFGFHLSQDEITEHRNAYRAIALLCKDLLTSRTPTGDQGLPSSEPILLREIHLELSQYAGVHNQPAMQLTPSINDSRSKASFEFFLPGAFATTDAVFPALKLTLAATICYIIYNAIAWPGILTCVVTVLFTGLSSTGAMKQKQLYRFSGAAIGGILGILTVSLLYPNMDSITSLVIVVVPVAFLSGWILRSARMGYVGVQIAFGFFLTALPGFSATTSITPARDRLIGVSLGILVMWFIFDQLWPIRTTDALEHSLMRIRKATAELQQLSQEQQSDRHAFQRLRAAVSLELVNAHQLGFSVQFEVGRHRKRELAKARRIVSEIERSTAEFYSVAIPLSHS